MKPHALLSYILRMYSLALSGRGKSRSYTKRGPGRMPYARRRDVA